MNEPSTTLVTGFTAFGRFAENPSAKLATESGRRFALIEVSYAAADDFIAKLDATTFDRLVMLGVAGQSNAVRIERVARNTIGTTPDVRGVVPAQRIIAPAAPLTLSATLWNPERPLPADVIFSDDAGDYLCNYLFFRALMRFGESKRVGFVHVPPLEAMDERRQRACLNAIMMMIESNELDQADAREAAIEITRPRAGEGPAQASAPTGAPG